MLVRNLVGRADIKKGRFRSFLLHTLRQYLIDKKRNAQAQKRIPEDRLVSLETVDLSTLSQSMAQATAEDAYHYAWIRTLLQEEDQLAEELDYFRRFLRKDKACC